MLRSGSLRTAVSAGPVAGDTALRICIADAVRGTSRACDQQGSPTHTCTSTGSARISARPSAIVLLFVASGSWLPASKLGWPARSNVLIDILARKHLFEVRCKVTLAHLLPLR